MPEIRVYEVECEVSMGCPTGDGGLLIYQQDPAKDTANVTPYLHLCTNPKDKTLYKLDKRYPFREWQKVNLDIVPGLKI